MSAPVLDLTGIPLQTPECPTSHVYCLLSPRSVTYNVLSNQRASLIVSGIGPYSQADVHAAPSGTIPVYLKLQPGCDPNALFDLGYYEYSVFNTGHTCCPVRVRGDISTSHISTQ